MAIVGVARVELHLPEARSLKDKRRVVKGLMERLHRKHRISIAETAHHDLLQRAELVLAVVARGEHEDDRLLEELRGESEWQGEAMLTSVEPELFASLAHATGIDPAKTFVMPNGRPITFVDPAGAPIRELFEA